VSEVIAEGGDLMSRAGEVARTVASHAPLTLRATKEALLRIQEKMTPNESDDLIVSCYMSQDFQEGMDAFLNKRPPVWTGK
jgi:enoyl-CoA hydratase